MTLTVGPPLATSSEPHCNLFITVETLDETQALADVLPAVEHLPETSSPATAIEKPEPIAEELYDDARQSTTVQITDHADRDHIDLIISKEFVPAKEAPAAISIRHRVGVRDDYINLVTEELLDADVSTTAETPLLIVDQAESLDVIVETPVTEATVSELNETDVIPPRKLEAEHDELEVVEVLRFSPEITAPVAHDDIQFSDQRDTYGRSTFSNFLRTAL